MRLYPTTRARPCLSLTAVRSRLSGAGLGLAVIAGLSVLGLASSGDAQNAPPAMASPPNEEKPVVDRVWTPPDVGALKYDAFGQQVRRGRDLFTATYAHIGPQAPDPAQRYAGNNLACDNCHLQAGTKKFGLPVYGLSADYPRYSARAGKEITLDERLNNCMRRSMNGRPLPKDSPEMKALVAYINFLSTGLPERETLAGQGSGHMPELDRAADPDRGKAIYASACLYCHNTDGSGIRRSAPWTDLGYLVPPLWGPDSFNDGAGMNRLITAANFVHFNMPHGTDYLAPQLSVEDAWDVAAYMVSQPRPKMKGLEKDFPDRLLKPVDTPYGPYADSFSELQHKYGPFGPIRAAIEKLKAEKAIATEEKGEAKKP